MNKREARRIARKITGVLIEDFVSSGGLVDMDAQMADAFDYIKSVIVHPRDWGDHPQRGSAIRRGIKRQKGKREMKDEIQTVHVDTMSAAGTRVEFVRDHESAIYHPGKYSCGRIQRLIDNRSLYLEYSFIRPASIVLTFSVNVF